MKHISRSLEDTKNIARIFLDTLQTREKACVVALEGDLGAGKTSFTQAVGGILGVGENMHSPTFVIMKVYDLKQTTHNPQPTTNLEFGRRSSVVGGWSKLIHIDAYRIEKESELLHLGWDDVINNPENIVFIEWPSNVPGLIPSDAKKIYMKFVDENTREIDL